MLSKLLYMSFFLLLMDVYAFVANNKQKWCFMRNKV